MALGEAGLASEIKTSLLPAPPDHSQQDSSALADHQCRAEEVSYQGLSVHTQIHGCTHVYMDTHSLLHSEPLPSLVGQLGAGSWL